MRLNPDCVRDVLLAAETLAGYEKNWMVTESLPADLLPYTYEEVAYHIRQCVKAGLIEIDREFIDGTFLIDDLTPEGHRRLQLVRNPEVYEKSKAAWLSKVQDGLISGSISGFFSVVSEIVKTALS
ncbi:MAG: DUF2513 domain-containing protein [Christensenellaceae bacterium]|nr:DUF2513 domain-containing protein [Christensenellaceae bacterium]MEA5070256.1 DUF2513 domain-containing protein [Christensenellaceae bacterium]